ncbi:MAG: hypothetical protein K8R02_05685 [Anaerohalosphaeraceae bacterium]|nr:hypothetical protein [Anaerohalosphaeraceae bacterium]
MDEKYKSKSLAIAVLFVLIMSPLVFAANTARIDVVRAKQILSDQDTEVIEDFVFDAFTEFLAVEDFSTIASVRIQIVSRSVSEQEAGQIQYGPRFFFAVQKQISEISGKIKAMPVSVRKSMLSMNLMIIISDLANVEIAMMALDYVDSEDLMTRYWAVNTFANPSLIAQLNLDYSSNTKITQKLKSRSLQEESLDVMKKLAAFAAAVMHPEAVQILTTIADKRIASYNSWLVSREMADSEILDSLADKIEADPDSKAAAGRSFALLYSAIIQRYIFGNEVLSDARKKDLKSVIAQSEKYLPKLLGSWQAKLKRAVEKGAMDTLLAEHNSLFGTPTTLGKLPEALGFDYGKAPDGSPKTAPPALPKPPKSIK